MHLHVHWAATFWIIIIESYDTIVNRNDRATDCCSRLFFFFLCRFCVNFVSNYYYHRIYAAMVIKLNRLKKWIVLLRLSYKLFFLFFLFISISYVKKNDYKICSRYLSVPIDQFGMIKYNSNEKTRNIILSRVKRKKIFLKNDGLRIVTECRKRNPIGILKSTLLRSAHFIIRN